MLMNYLQVKTNFYINTNLPYMKNNFLFKNH